MIELISQLDIQRLGGICAKYPVSCLIYKMLTSVMEINSGTMVLDLTYGEGRFWKAFGLLKPYIIAIDIHRLKWHVIPDEFYQTAAWRWRHVVKHQHIDLVVVDPPWAEWRRGWDRRGHYLLNKCLGSPKAIIDAAVDASRHYNAYLLIHYRERVVPNNMLPIIEKWFRGRSRLANLSKQSWFGILKPMEDGG